MATPNNPTINSKGDKPGTPQLAHATPAPGVQSAAAVPENPKYTSSFHKAYGKKFPPGQVSSPGGQALKRGHVDVKQPQSGNEPHTGSAHRPAHAHETHAQRHQRHARVLYPASMSK